MKLVKSLLLGSAAALVAGAGAQAADLPARKAAPAEYVKVCDAYGAGFFYIPGTETCLKIGGRVRADFAMSRGVDVFATTNTGAKNSTTTTGYVAGYDPRNGATYNALATAAGSENRYGWEARGRVDLDARTQTEWGSLQTVASLRLGRVTGSLSDIGPSVSSSAAAATLEAAYIRFAGFTFGAAKDNFAFMPSTFYGAGHWASFANGAKQIAYTAILGGGMSATLAIQDYADTTNGAAANAGLDSSGNIAYSYDSKGNLVANGTGAYAYNRMPQLNGRLDWDQGWGSMALMGALGHAVSDTVTGSTSSYNANASKTTYAVGAGVKLNLPMIAAGDVLWLNGAYANGMTEYTVNYTYFKPSDTKLNAGGFVTTAPSWVNYTDSAGNAKIETLKSWDLAAIYTHYWTPQWRHSFLASYGRIEGGSLSSSIPFGVPGAVGNTTVWNIGTQLAWLPIANFEIGVDILYNRVAQDVRRQNGTISAGGFTGNVNGTTVTRESTNGLTGRLRVERTF